MKKEKFISPLLMWIIIIIGIIIIFILSPNKKLFNRNLFTIIIFSICLLYWIYLFFTSVFVHRQAAYSVVKINKIIKTGPYNIVRHPIYSADIILFIGIFFLFPNLKAMLCIFYAIVILILWMNIEEKALINKFKKDYLDYKNKVPMFIPKLKL